MTSWGLGITGVGFFIAFAFLVVGCFLDAIPAIIIVGTTLQPLAQSVHMHPVQFAIIGIVSLAFGLVTPPYGLCLMISCAIAKVPLKFALKDTLIERDLGIDGISESVLYVAGVGIPRTEQPQYDYGLGASEATILPKPGSSRSESQ